MKKWIAGLVIFLCALVATLIVMHQQAAHVSSQPPADLPITVKTQVAQKMLWSSQFQTNATLEAQFGVDIIPISSGRITELHFKSMQSVKKNQLLAEIDHQIESFQLKSVQAQLWAAQRNLARQQRLYQLDQSISHQQLDQSLAAVRQLAAQVKAAEAALELKRVRAPFSGVVGINNVSVGEFVSPQTTIITHLTASGVTRVRFIVPEQYIQNLQVGHPISIRSDLNPSHRFKGQITAISTQIDPRTHGLQLKGQLNPSDLNNQLTPGALVSVQIPLGDRKSVIVIPENAVLYTLYGNSVFIAKPNPKKSGHYIAHKVNITNGDARDGLVPVLSGIQEGDQLITTGQFRLTDGRAIVIKTT